MAKEPIKLNCSVEADDSWLQLDCHWQYNRFFRFTWKTFAGDLYNHKGESLAQGASVEQRELYYRIGTTGEYVRVFTDKLTTNKSRQITYTPEEVSLNTHCTREATTLGYLHKVTEEDIKTLLKNRTSDGWVPITARMVVKDKDGKTYEASNTFDYFLELPPAPVENIQATVVVNTPGELKYSWSPATGAFEKLDSPEISSLDGYCIELMHCPAGSSSFSPVTGLRWDTEALKAGKYSLTKDSTSDITEVYIEKETPTSTAPICTEFYFNPKKLGIEGKDRYTFIIYPYTIYDGAYLSNFGTESDVRKVSKGVVRIMYNNRWVEGQVYVMTDSGWKEADSIYTMHEGSWREAT
jgi:hypothetical protein